MRHSVFGKKLSRNKNERRSLIRNLLKSLIAHGAIKTSKAKALAARSEMEKLITKAKKGTEAQRRDILSHIPDRNVVQKLVEMSTTRFAGRNSGYTRIVKLGKRLGDSTQEVLLSFVDEEVVQEVIKPETKKVEEKKIEVKKPVVRKAKPAKKK